MDIADILIHVHPELPAAQRALVEEALGSQAGVISAHFSREHPHELVVAYDPETIRSTRLLDIVRVWDAAAMMAGL